jgi:hypothetical protein
MKKYLLLALLAIGLPVCASATPSYLPSGPQTGVSLATVTAGGWTQCYDQTMATPIGNSGENVLNSCNGDYLMMAGRQTGSDVFLVLAAALRSDTIIDTGATSNTHLANGSEWWYSPNWSWGFTAAGDTVQNGSCNFDASSPTSMCLHTVDFTGGYRINDIQSLNGSIDFEKVFFVANEVSVPEPASLGILGLGLAALGVMRRKRAA